MSAKKDFTQVAFDVFRQATGETAKPAPLNGRKANSSKGGKIGGKKRAEAMGAEERTAQAKKAAQTRWEPTSPRKSRTSPRRLNEAITVDLVSRKLREQGYEDDDTIVVEREQTTEIDRINKLLATASKNGSGKGYPDFIVTNKALPDFVFVIECKADVTKHQSDTLDGYADYAVDGARLYADYLSREMDVLYVGVSGQSEQELKVSHFLKLKDEREHREIFKDCGLQDFPSYLEQLKNHRFRVDYDDLLRYVSGLNEQLHARKIPEKERAILFSGILIALEDDTFRDAYSSYTKADKLARFLIQSVIDRLETSNVPQERQAGLKAVFAAIQTHTGLIAEGYLLELVREVDTRIRTFIKGNEYTDIISRCYVEFLKYANDDGSLGIVLTPQHIAALFCDIAQLNADSVVIDNCCGTGGFLVAAMNKMVRAAKGSKKVIDRIKARQVLGIEYQNHIFNLCVSNMIIHGDGKSNIWNGDCFKLMENLRAFRPNVALLNPPYNDVSGVDELVFIENALDALEKNGIAVAIVPMRCALYDKGQGVALKERLLKKHTLDAVMSMPDDLFYPKGVICCVMVFKAHVPHDTSGQAKTWFGYWKNDGHIKVKNRGRVDLKDSWESLKSAWLTLYKNRAVLDGACVTHAVSPKSEWCAEAYMVTDYSKLDASDFERTVMDFAIHRLITKQTNSVLRDAVRAKSARPKLATDAWKAFEYRDLFEIKKGKRLTKDEMREGKTPFVSAIENNNGLTAHIDLAPIHDAGTISVVYNGNGVADAFYQPVSYWASDDVNVLYAKDEISVEVALFLCTLIRLEKYRFSYGRKWHLDRMLTSEIRLPVTPSGRPDYRWIARFMETIPFTSSLKT